MPMVKHCIALDEDTTVKLEELVRLGTGKSNKSSILRDLIDKEYAIKKGALNEA